MNDAVAHANTCHYRKLPANERRLLADEQRKLAAVKASLEERQQSAGNTSVRI